ncbi:MAG TPA: hypothetical protein VFR29_00070 [Steroidobacteraceae bacterium]|nr:hypothetical protein [Steroidobacteraceae bacterium]
MHASQRGAWQALREGEVNWNALGILWLLFPELRLRRWEVAAA